MGKNSFIHRWGGIVVPFLLSIWAEQLMNPLAPLYYLVYGSAAFYVIYWLLDFERFGVRFKDKLYISSIISLIVLCFWIGKNYSEELESVNNSISENEQIIRNIKGKLHKLYNEAVNFALKDVGSEEKAMELDIQFLNWFNQSEKWIQENMGNGASGVFINFVSPNIPEKYGMGFNNQHNWVIFKAVKVQENLEKLIENTEIWMEK